MPVTRTVIPDLPIDEMGFHAYLVEGTNGADRYATKRGDHIVRTFGGNDNVAVVRGWIEGEYHDIRVELGDGNDRANGGPSGTLLYGNAGNDALLVRAGDGASGAWGGIGNDTIRSLGGDDGNGLFGGPGSDRLYFSEDRDHGYGGPGRDHFYLHRAGDDTLHFAPGHTGTAATADKPDERDVVHGFDPYPDDHVHDIIDLSAIDASPSEGDQAFSWIGQLTAVNKLDPGEVGWFAEGRNDVATAWIDGGGMRQAIVLDDFAPQAGQLDATDFLL